MEDHESEGSGLRKMIRRLSPLSLSVVDGAEIKCDMGTLTGQLKARASNPEYVEGHRVCDVMDHKPGISIPTFGLCRLLGGPCVPVTPTPWISPVKLLLDGSALIVESLLPCTVGGIIGVLDPGQSTVYILRAANTAEILQQALLLYADVFAAVGRFPSSEDGLDAFLAATGVGEKGVDTAYNKDSYNCQGFADALAQSLLESGVAEDARLIHMLTYEEKRFWFDKKVVNHAVTEIETADGTRYLVDGQSQSRSPGYQLDEDGEIPASIRDGWLLDLANDSYGHVGHSDYVEFGSPRDVGDTWSPEMNVTTQSTGLNHDREDRLNVDWETTWDPEPGSSPELPSDE